jgi:hypothetical protein
MLFKSVLLLLTIVVPGISQHRYSSLFIEIENHQITEGCANFNFSAKIQLRLTHVTKILDGCENHTISSNISMSTNNIALCTFNSTCYGISNNLHILNASDIPWIELRYVFCGDPILQNIYLWDYNDFNISTNGSNFFASNRFGNIPISNCNHGYTSLENVLFCKKETGDLDCDFKSLSFMIISIPKIIFFSVNFSTVNDDPIIFNNKYTSFFNINGCKPHFNREHCIWNLYNNNRINADNNNNSVKYSYNIFYNKYPFTLSFNFNTVFITVHIFNNIFTNHRFNYAIRYYLRSDREYYFCNHNDAICINSYYKCNIRF